MDALAGNGSDLDRVGIETAGAWEGVGFPAEAGRWCEGSVGTEVDSVGLYRGAARARADLANHSVGATPHFSMSSWICLMRSLP